MSEIKVDALTGKTTAKTVTVTVGATATQSLEQGLLKCWVHANTAATIEDSLGTSSSVDDGTGQYTYNVSNAFATVSYSNGNGNIDITSAGWVEGVVWTYPTSQWRTRWYNSGGSYTDVDNAYVLAGDLA